MPANPPNVESFWAGFAGLSCVDPLTLLSRVGGQSTAAAALTVYRPSMKDIGYSIIDKLIH